MKSKAIAKMLALFLALTMVLGGTATVFAVDSNAPAATENAADEIELINLQSEWKYLDDNTDPAGTGDRTSWTVADFDDSAWNTSAGHNAKFGAKRGAIADLGNNSTPEILLKQYKEDGNDIPAYFFRTSFNIDSKSDEFSLTGTLKYDDAAIVYINGTKVASFDEPEGGFDSNLSYGGSNAGDPKDVSFTVDSSVLKEGKNVVAVELHQGRESSSDIYFEMSSLKLEKIVVEQSSIALTVGADETQMNFTWYCNQEGDGTLYLAKQSELVNGEMPANAKAITASAAAANKSGYYSNQATATGLEYGTTYAYQLVNGDMKSDVMTFTTTDRQREFSFGFVGDPQIGAGSRDTDTEGWDKSLNIMDGSGLFDGIDFILSAGDQVNTASNEAEYDGFLEHSVLKSMPIATVVGNHDSGSSSYSQHFEVSNVSPQGATAAGSDNYFVYNNVLFLVLNSNNRSTTEHKAFMEAAIADTADQDIAWKVVTFHHSIYSVASHAEDDDILQRRAELVPIFKDLDIDVVLMGHDHVYCRTYMMDGMDPMTDAELYDDADYSSITNPEGILYVTANSGSGSKYYNIQNNLEFPYSRVMNQERVPNVSRVDVSDESFRITTYRTNDMSVVDTFTINREQADNPGTDVDNPGVTDPENPGTNADKPSITDPENPGANADNPSVSDPENPANSNIEAPQTGDTSNVAFWIIIMAICTVVFIGTLVYTKRKKECK